MITQPAISSVCSSLGGSAKSIGARPVDSAASARKPITGSFSRRARARSMSIRGAGVVIISAACYVRCVAGRAQGTSFAASRHLNGGPPMSKLPFTLSAVALAALAGCATESRVAPAPAPVVVQPAPSAGAVVVPQNAPAGSAVVVPQSGTGAVVVAPTTPGSLRAGTGRIDTIL